MRVLDPVTDHKKRRFPGPFRLREQVFQLRVLLAGGDGGDSLMMRPAQLVELAGIHLLDRDAAFAAGGEERPDAAAPLPLGDQNVIQAAPGFERFMDGVAARHHIPVRLKLPLFLARPGIFRSIHNIQPQYSDEFVARTGRIGRHFCPNAGTSCC